mmetsp:Transcript_44601/g.95860  ORF Transcript_44601/g.95860 Transcript_44601/m.95860 type:complete len:314 (+) Transcript_44601:773-1714(+)
MDVPLRVVVCSSIGIRLAFMLEKSTSSDSLGDGSEPSPMMGGRAGGAVSTSAGKEGAGPDGIAPRAEIAETDGEAFDSSWSSAGRVEEPWKEKDSRGRVGGGGGGGGRNAGGVGVGPVALVPPMETDVQEEGSPSWRRSPWWWWCCCWCWSKPEGPDAQPEVNERRLVGSLKPSSVSIFSRGSIANSGGPPPSPVTPSPPFMLPAAPPPKPLLLPPRPLVLLPQPAAPTTPTFPPQPLPLLLLHGQGQPLSQRRRSCAAWTGSVEMRRRDKGGGRISRKVFFSSKSKPGGAATGRPSPQWSSQPLYLSWDLSS